MKLKRVGSHQREIETTLRMWYAKASNKPSHARPMWKFAAVLPQPEELGNLVLRVPTLTLAADSKVSFEKFCRDLEHEFTRTDYGLVCECCESAHPCSSCRFAVGFHACACAGKGRQWYRKGTLFNGVLDVQR